MSRIPQDYHLHSDFSFDCRTPIARNCERAIELGIPEIAITDHLNFVARDNDAGYFDPDGFFREIERCRERYGDRLVIRAGIEAGESHVFAGPTHDIIGQYPFDFVIGSLHWIGQDLVMSHRYFDGKEIRSAYRAYFAELLEMVRTGDFDVIGHLDVPKRYGFDLAGPFQSAEFEDTLREIFRVCAQRGIGIEINTGSMRRRVGEPSPALDVLGWYREEGGEILTIGSDGHRAEAVGYRLDVAVGMALDAGFRHLTSFAGRQPVAVPLHAGVPQTD